MAGRSPIVSTAVEPESDVRREARTPSTARIATEGKFLRVLPAPQSDTAAAGGERRADVSRADVVAGERFLVKGVPYGTFAPDAQGYQFPAITQVSADFRQMAALGVNTVRTYTPPRRDVLDAAAAAGL